MSAIGVFQSGSKIDKELLEKGIAKFEQNIELKVKKIPSEDHDVRYFAGTKEQRIEGFKCCLHDPEVEYLWAARGGYGSIDLLDCLPKTLDKWKGKKVLGFSDVTAIHSFLSNIGEVSYHAPMVATNQWLNLCESMNEQFYRIFNQKSLDPIEVQGDLNGVGRLVGGNLTVLASLMGTPWQLKLKKGDVLLLEDVNEPYYALARSLKQFSFTPNFKDCVLCWGELTQCEPTMEYENLVYELSKPYIGKYLYGTPVGHGANNYACPLGGKIHYEGGLLYFDGH